MSSIKASLMFLITAILVCAHVLARDTAVNNLLGTDG